MQNRKRKRRKSFSTLMSAMIITISFSVFTAAVILAVSAHNDEDFFESLASWTNRTPWGGGSNGIIDNGTSSIPEAIPAYLPQPVEEIEPDPEPEPIPEPEPYVPVPIIYYIAWPFTAFSRPCFTSDAVINFPPGRIVTYEICEQGWALIYTSHGGGWVNTVQEKVHTTEVLGLFEEIGGYIVEWMHPQLVLITERYGDWIATERDGRQLWFNFYFEPPIHLLEEFMEQFGDTVSVFYENLATGFTFSHNACRVFFGASATKLPFGLYIFQKAEQGDTSMNSIHSFTAADYWQGSGVIRHRYEYGATFTQERLLFLMLSPSDNIATRILRRVHSLTGYRQFIADIGANSEHVQNLTYSYLTAYDAGIFMREAYRYITSGGRYSQLFRNTMLSNRYPFVISSYPVASKSGWAATFGGAWHDMAIVFAPSPYSLSLLSSRAGHVADRRVYDAISMFVQEFNTKWFYAGG